MVEVFRLGWGENPPEDESWVIVDAVARGLFKVTAQIVRATRTDHMGLPGAKSRVTALASAEHQAKRLGIEKIFVRDH